MTAKQLQDLFNSLNAEWLRLCKDIGKSATQTKAIYIAMRTVEYILNNGK